MLYVTILKETGWESIEQPPGGGGSCSKDEIVRLDDKRWPKTNMSKILDGGWRVGGLGGGEYKTE